MVGWTVLFALFALIGGALALSGIESVVTMSGSALSSALCLVSVLTRLIRDGAR